MSDRIVRNPAFRDDVAASFARQDALTLIGAKGRKARAGQSISVTDIEIRACAKDGEKLRAVLQQTCMPG